MDQGRQAVCYSTWWHGKVKTPVTNGWAEPHPICGRFDPRATFFRVRSKSSSLLARGKNPNAFGELDV